MSFAVCLEHTGVLRDSLESRHRLLACALSLSFALSFCFEIRNHVHW